jgi:F0F1-type ATP synthase membrane subunit a
MERVPSSLILPPTLKNQNNTSSPSIFGFGNKFLRYFIKSFNSTFGRTPKRAEKAGKVLSFLEMIEDFIRTNFSAALATSFAIVAVLVIIVCSIVFLVWRSKRSSKKPKNEKSESRFSHDLLQEFFEVESGQVKKVCPSAPPREKSTYLLNLSELDRIRSYLTPDF